MNVAIMQPYLFPWIGYFQLINQSDLFVLYDDACFMKQGYINRNSILSAGAAQRFTLPVPGASVHKRIGELTFSRDVKKLLKTLTQSYNKAPYFAQVMPMIADVLEYDDRSITGCCEYAISRIFAYLHSDKKIVRSSQLDYCRDENAENKVIGICKATGADVYVNSSGGMHLYSAANFAEQGITLRFLQAENMTYYQGQQEFVPWLSIIDVLMFCEPEQVKQALNHFTYIN